MNKLVISGEVSEEVMAASGEYILADLRSFAFTEAGNEHEMIVGLPDVRIWSIAEQAADPVYCELNFRNMRHFAVTARTTVVAR